VQRPPHFVLGERGIGVAGALAGGVDLPGDDCDERRVVALGAGDIEVQQFEATDTRISRRS
jgi:hypothetical protein